MAEVPAAARPEDAPDARLLLGIIRALAAEAGAVTAAAGLDSGLGRDLGLDSLALVELRLRVEDAVGVVLPDSILSADTAGDWLAALRAARTGAAPPIPRVPVLSPVPVSGAAGGLPASADTLPAALAWHASVHPGRVHIRLLEYAGEQPAITEISYGDLQAGARVVAAGLRAGGLRPGETVAIMLPTCREFFLAFMGTLMAGAVAVPIYPPARPAGLEEHLRRQAGILRNARAAVLITVTGARLIARLLRAQVPSLRAVATTAELQAAGGSGRILPGVRADDTALLQYTSGSTGDPKGVILAHRHLLANIRAMGTAAQAGPSDIFVSWLPLYHDMGLIGVWLAGLYFGFPAVVMSPLAFLARPARWLRAISDHHATLSASPNFGYELCLRQVTSAQLEEVDLSSWRLAFSGSEAVSPATIRGFTERFASCGLRPEALAPAYGLAEAGVGVAFPPPGRGPLIDTIDRHALAQDRRAIPARETGPAALQVVSCGQPLPRFQVRVIDAAGRPLPERHEGRIEFAGPSATPGYFRDEAATAALRHGPWIDTGDLGYLAAGELYLTGRVKDIIICRGRNLHPDETEQAAALLPGAEPGGVAIFGVPDPQQGTERLVVAAETRLQPAAARQTLRSQITALTHRLLGVTPDEVMLTAPGSIPKTASGKTRRAATRDRYQAGTLGKPAPSTRRQIARFALSGARPALRRAGRASAAWLYADYAWLATVLIGGPAWLLVAALPGLRVRWAVARAAGGLLRRALGIPLRVTGQFPSGRPFVIVANHASFIDALVLLLCLPEPVRFAAAQRFAAQRLAGPFLRRIGCEFLQPGGPQQAASATRRLATVLAAGHSLAVWPEGSLHPAPGLRPFHLGAFQAAVDAGVPVIPVGIRGTRDVVRPGTKLPRHAAASVWIGEPIIPAGIGWQAALALRGQAHSAILQLSGEPALA